MNQRYRGALMDAARCLVHTASGCRYRVRGRNRLSFAAQDARKGVLFDSFPPVLQLQLKRFEYDFQRDMMVKVGCLALSECLVLVPGSLQGALCTLILPAKPTHHLHASRYTLKAPWKAGLSGLPRLARIW